MIKDCSNIRNIVLVIIGFEKEDIEKLSLFTGKRASHEQKSMDLYLSL